ncbi:MAG: hypothetical protein IJ038_05845 [Clostridia bacterium]|nr:hypothetical protein [Clostridia bacterium]
MSADNEQAKNAPLSSAEEKSSAPPNLASMIDGILANPELITMVASALGPMLKNQSTAEENKAEEKNTDKTETEEAVPTSSSVSGADEKLPDFVAALAPMIASMQKSASLPSSKASHGADRRSCLLLALKPYLCKERCEAIDYMVKLGKLSEVFRHLN